jgi:hypothetical protein
MGIYLIYDNFFCLNMIFGVATKSGCNFCWFFLKRVPFCLSQSYMPSFAKVGRSTVTSRWICRTISLQVTIVIPRIANRPYLSWISIARPWSQNCHILKAPHSHRRAEEAAVTEASAEMEKAAIPAPMAISTGMTRNATSATRKGIQQRIVPRSRVTTMIVPRRALLAASIKSRRISSQSRKHLLRSTLNLHS